MRWLKRIAIFLVILIIAFVGAGLFMAWKYGDIVRNVAIDQLNQTLQSEMTVSSIDVSSIEKAPYLSLQFNQVALMEPKSYNPEPDTLFYFDKLYLQFNVWDILQGNYQIKKVEIAEGFAKMRVDLKGNPNYDFLRADTSASDTSSVAIGLDEIKIVGVDYLYHDRQKEIQVQTRVDHAEISGNFLKEKLNLEIAGNFDQSWVKVGPAIYLNRYNLKINTAMGIGGDWGGVQIDRGSVRIENQLKLNLVGKINEKTYTFEAGGKNLDLAVLRHVLPADWKEPIQDYRAKGKLDLDLKLHGDAESSLAPKLDVDFAIQDGWVKNTSTETELSKLACAGSFTNGKYRTLKSMVFDLDTFSVQLLTGQVAGRMKLANLERKNLDVRLHGQLDLSDLQSFLKLEGVELLDGKAQFAIAGKTPLSEWIEGVYKPEYNPFRGRLEFNGVSYKSLHVDQNLADFKGLIAFDQEGIIVDGVSGVFAKTPVQIDGELFNFYSWLFRDDKKLRMVMNVKADEVQLENLLGAKSQRQEAGEAYPLIEMQLTTEIGHFSYRRFEANNLKMRFYMAEHEFTANPVTFDGMGGSFSGKFSITDREDGNADVRTEGDLKQVDIQQFFYQFEDFGQAEIRSEHLRGATDIDFKMTAIANQKLEIDPKDIDAYAHVVVTGGELKNYSTLQAISDYVKSSLALRALIRESELRKELNNVKFDRLENDIFIGDGQIHIPRMTIRTSILTLHLDGTHSFTNQLDYHFDFDLSELLVKKKEYNTEYGYVSDDGTGGFRLFLKITGDAADPDIDLDKERKKQFRKERRKNQESDLVKALSRDLGLGKHDEGRKVNQEFDYQIEWEEDSSADTTAPATTKPKNKPTAKDSTKKKFRLLQPNEEETEYFEYDDL
ncbi:hypothetical protein KFE98_05020 [bacterium SCSIO 12741]|nr:hypothetical protein KFE98_05020 [bacterium SCSIO 12741]